MYTIKLKMDWQIHLPIEIHGIECFVCIGVHSGENKRTIGRSKDQ